MDMLFLEHMIRTYPKKNKPVINWTCSACTFINRSYIDECEICDTGRTCDTDRTCDTGRTCDVKPPTSIDGRQDSSQHSECGKLQSK